MIVKLVNEQYQGDKAALQPIDEKIAAAVTQFGVDMAINLKGEPPSERLEAAGSFGSMVSHRGRITDISQVDEELIGRLKQAYEKVQA